MSVDNDRDKQPKGSYTQAILGIIIVVIGNWIVYDPELFMPNQTTFDVVLESGNRYTITPLIFKDLAGLIVLFGAALFYTSGRSKDL